MKPLLFFPDRIPCIALNQPYAGLLFGKEPGEVGPKSLETRLWPWPYPPGWLAIYATMTPDGGASKRLRSTIISTVFRKNTNDLRGCILGVVWIDGCREMTADDSEAGCIPFDPGEAAREGRPRLVWPLRAAHLFAKPDFEWLKRGPQKFVFVPDGVVRRGLGLAAGEAKQMGLGL